MEWQRQCRDGIGQMDKNSNMVPSNFYQKMTTSMMAGMTITTGTTTRQDDKDNDDNKKGNKKTKMTRTRTLRKQQLQHPVV